MVLRLFRQAPSRQLLTSGVLMCSLTLTSVARADYVPPSNASAPTSAPTITGRRGGCSSHEATSLTTLAPASHIGQTLSTHPTFSWYVPDAQSFPMEFHLEEYIENGDRRRIEKIELDSAPGMMSLSLPANQAGLEVGRRYRWQVVLLCRPNYPSSALVASAEMEVVETPSTLGTQLTTLQDPNQRANLLAKSGFWYDAWAELQGAKGLQLSLLEDLVSSETTTGQPEHGAKLQQIVEFEQLQGSIETTINMN